MRPRKYLVKLQIAAIKRVQRLKRSLSLSSHPSNASEIYLVNTTIEALNTWNNFSRSFYLSCTLNPKTVNGNKITTTVITANFNDAIGRAIVYFKPSRTPNSSGIWHRRDEPTWHDPNTLLSVCGHIGCSNIINISNGLSGGQTFFSGLPTFRNFYAHKNQQTENAAMQKSPIYSIPATLRPSEALRAFPINETSTLLEKWLDEITVTIEYLCYE